MPPLAICAALSIIAQQILTSDPKADWQRTRAMVRILFTGSPDFGRMAVLPVFVGAILQALGAPKDGTVTPDAHITNEAFTRATTILGDNTAALELVPNTIQRSAGW